MKKTIIAIWGNGNTGKTSSILRFDELIHQKYQPSKPLCSNGIPPNDITRIYAIKGVNIGIESQGDPNSNLFVSLKLFIKNDCKIIICATRTRGSTVNFVNEISEQHEYDIIWFSNLFSCEKVHDTINIRSAELIETILSDLLNNCY